MCFAQFIGVSCPGASTEDWDDEEGYYVAQVFLLNSFSVASAENWVTGRTGFICCCNILACQIGVGQQCSNDLQKGSHVQQKSCEQAKVRVIQTPNGTKTAQDYSAKSEEGKTKKKGKASYPQKRNPNKNNSCRTRDISRHFETFSPCPKNSWSPSPRSPRSPRSLRAEATRSSASRRGRRSRQR